MDFKKKRTAVIKDFIWHYAIFRAKDYIFGRGLFVGIFCGQSGMALKSRNVCEDFKHS
jgi:hypothetical protein